MEVVVGGEIAPMRVVTSTFMVCYARPRRMERVTSTRCESCGWWEVPPVDDGRGTGSLFDPVEGHTQVECDRLQTDEEFRAEFVRLRRAGLVGGLDS